MKLKKFFDEEGDPVTVEMDGAFVNLECTQSTNGDPRSAMVCMDADTAEAVGRRLLKGARKLRKAEANGEA